jgi:hypothetical protein
VLDALADAILVPCVAHIAGIATEGRFAAKYGDARETVVSDNAVRAILLQAFNTETTKNHGAARSGSDDKSRRAESATLAELAKSYRVGRSTLSRLGV